MNYKNMFEEIPYKREDIEASYTCFKVIFTCDCGAERCAQYKGWGILTDNSNCCDREYYLDKELKLYRTIIPENYRKSEYVKLGECYNPRPGRDRVRVKKKERKAEPITIRNEMKNDLKKVDC